MMAEESSFRTTVDSIIEVIEPIPSAKNFQDELRQWFTAMSSEGRAAALGFEDKGPMVATLLAKVGGLARSCNGNGRTAEEQPVAIHRAAPSSPSSHSLPPKRTTDRLVSNETFDWEARIALDIIEKTWEEIMKVGEPNTSGVNQKEFAKNSFQQNDVEEKSNPFDSDDVESNAGVKEVVGETSCQSENITRGDIGDKEVASDAYRIPSEKVDVEGKSVSADADAEGNVCQTSRSCKSGEDEKGIMETMNYDVVGSDGPTSGANGESSDDCGSPSEFASDITHATATSIPPPLPSAFNGSKADMQYSSQSNNSRRIAEIMDNTRCIFPVSAKIGDRTTSHEPQQHYYQQRNLPFITISPSYLDTVSGDELLVAFDEIMAMACTDHSLDDPCSFVLSEEATPASWMDLVRSYSTIDNAGSKSVPLYMLILCHFQVSLAKAYPGCTVSTNEKKNGAKKKRPITLKSTSDWLTALMTRIRELEKSESAAIEKMLSDLVSKLPEAERLSNDTKNHSLENHLLISFKVWAGRLGGPLDNSMNPGNALQSIDSSIEESLRVGGVLAYEVLLSSIIYHVEDENHLVNDGRTQSIEHEIQNTTIHNSHSTSGNGKKKRKKNKKKKRKNSTASANTPAKPLCVEETVEIDTPENIVVEEKVEVITDESSEKVETHDVDTEKESSIEEDVDVKDETPVTDGTIVSEPHTIQPSVSRESDTPTIETVKPEEEILFEEVGVVTVESKDDTHLSQTEESVNGVAEEEKIAPDEAEVSKKDEPVRDEQTTNEDDQEDQWETVEIRPRGRKKGTDKGHNSRPGNQTNSGGTHSKKKAPRTKEARARNKTRKMVKDILGGVLDTVEETVRRRRNASRERAHMLRKQSAGNIVPISQDANPQQSTGSSLRDILVRGSQIQQVKNTNAGKSGPLSYSERAKALMKSDSIEEKRNTLRRKNEKPSHITGTKTTKALKAARASPADQNTIPTIASTNSAFTPSVMNVTRKPGATKSTDSSSSDSSESKKAKNVSSHATKYVSPSPPLPTLLSPGNNNSTSSSVASSLDAPHAGHHCNKSQSENDVGCHLLDVCDRLSREIDVFMKRRDAALAVRRHERALVLSALEKTLGLIWQGKPTVEMYGSCATNLDLPSSDLDVVVCGLDRPCVKSVPSPTSSSVASNSPQDSNSVDQDEKSHDDGPPSAESHQDTHTYQSDERFSQHQMTPFQMQMMYGHMSVNAERVLRLAMELEHQPWAVHVKAIPTASVPVIKILADPARLQGVMNGNADWLLQQPMNGQTPTTLTPRGVAECSDSRAGKQTHIPHYPNQRSSPLWRGADVVNGLLKVDITFEGPEHGGIGSTIFSRKVVEDFSNETGLSPEYTPQVQVLMVLKELLAQRRSNEPFSGGLSSYALLLLVISMIGERRIIREELDKTERQRRVVAAGGGNSALRSTQDTTESSTNEVQKRSLDKSENKKAASSKPQDAEPKYAQILAQRTESASEAVAKPKDSAWKEKATKIEEKTSKKAGAAGAPVASSQQSSGPSSWANIARNKGNSLNASGSDKKQNESEKDASESKIKSNATGKDQIVPKKPSSFADAVAKGKALPPAPVTLTSKKATTMKKKEVNSRFDGLLDPPSSKLTKTKVEKQENTMIKSQQPKEKVDSTKVAKNIPSATTNKPSATKANAVENNLESAPDSSGFPQGFHDVIEVLCSGETTPGKLLMHFLLFYGQHFESQSTAIDYSGTHQRDATNNNGYSLRSSYMIRRNTGSYDPVTGMYTVDPIVVYDPLEGAENNNVARSCFAWSSIRWVFAQSYMTLSSAAEQNATEGTRNRAAPMASEGPSYGHDESGNVVVDPSSPLLELLLSF